MPSRDKVKAIEASPQDQQNDIQVKQFLELISCCGIFMTSAFADLAIRLLELTKKGVDFKWTEEHTQAVKTPKEKLINYVTLQDARSSKAICA